MSEKVTVKVERSVLHLPAIALRGLVVFPNNLLHFEVGREKSIAAVEWAVNEGVTTGTSDTTFSPNSNCLRAQIVSFLYRAAK